MTTVTFSLKNQLDGTITKTHAEHLQLDQLDNQGIQRIKRLGLHVRSHMQPQ